MTRFFEKEKQTAISFAEWLNVFDVFIDTKTKYFLVSKITKLFG